MDYSSLYSPSLSVHYLVKVERVEDDDKEFCCENGECSFDVLYCSMFDVR